MKTVFLLNPERGTKTGRRSVGSARVLCESADGLLSGLRLRALKSDERRGSLFGWRLGLWKLASAKSTLRWPPTSHHGCLVPRAAQESLSICQTDQVEEQVDREVGPTVKISDRLACLLRSFKLDIRGREPLVRAGFNHRRDVGQSQGQSATAFICELIRLENETDPTTVPNLEKISSTSRCDRSGRRG